MTQSLPQGMLDMGARTPEQIRDAYLRDIKNAAIDAGRTPPDIGPGSFDHIRATALANHLSLIEANALVIGEQLFLDGAVGADLERRAANHSIERRLKEGSVGPVILTSSAPSPVAAGAQLTSVNGTRFEVTTGGLYANGDEIEIAAIDSGRATNLPEGTVLQWVNAPPYADVKTAVGPGGLVNGTEDETDDELRARVMDRMRHVPTESNHQAMVERAERSNSSVQKAFVYMALKGPSTYALAVAASPTDTNRSREIPATTITNVVAPVVAGSHFDAVYPQIVSVVDEPVQYLSIGLALPAAHSATTPGIGGGWVNGQPWPPAEADNDYRAVVSGPIQNAGRFPVIAEARPVAGVTRISWLSPVDWRLYSSTVIAVDGTEGYWIVQLDRPFTGIAPGHVIWPAAENQAAYVAAILKAFALMGPGEMTDQASVLKRSARFPAPSQSWPYSLGATQLRAISDAGNEVLSTQYLGIPSRSTPTVSPVAPRILVPQNIGFYPIPD